MLARYTLYRGRRPAGDPLPQGIRQDTRKHTRHCLRPTAELVAAALSSGTPAEWKKFKSAYLSLLESRFKEDPDPFKAIATLAEEQDVYLGCSCPSKRNPDVKNCHTVAALGFMEKKFPRLTIVFP